MNKNLEVLKKYGLSIDKPGNPDAYLVKRGGVEKIEITRWGYQKLAFRRGIEVDTMHITEEMVSSHYFCSYCPLERSIGFDLEKWKPEFSDRIQPLEKIKYFVVILKRDGVKEYNLFDKEIIFNTYANNNPQWKDKGHNGIAMHEKSVIRYLLKRIQDVIPDELNMLEETYEEYWSEGADQAVEIAEKVCNCGSIEELGILFKTEEMKKLKNNKSIIALFVKRKQEIIDNLQEEDNETK